MDAFAQRICDDELMDQPGLDPSVHRRALCGLSRVNWWSGTAGQLWRTLERVSRRHGLQRLQILDLACGAGDVALALAHRAQRAGVALSVHGWDKSPVAVDHAQSLARQQGLADVAFSVKDVIRDPIDQAYDVVICTLFLHHLPLADTVPFLQKMKSAARHAVLIDDLRRTRTGYTLAWLGTRLLTRSHVVHVDGPMSVRAAFSIPEIRSLAETAGLETARISPHWPQRFLLTWEQS